VQREISGDVGLGVLWSSARHALMQHAQRDAETTGSGDHGNKKNLGNQKKDVVDVAERVRDMLASLRDYGVEPVHAPAESGIGNGNGKSGIPKNPDNSVIFRGEEVGVADMLRVVENRELWARLLPASGPEAGSGIREIVNSGQQGESA
jgi:hypothetical protein